MTSIPQSQPDIVCGVDTHRDTHTAAVLDNAGRLLGAEQFPANKTGYVKLLNWARVFGALSLVGVEGTGSYGSGLAAHLREHDVPMVEIDRPSRKTRRWQGKSDPVDAEAAARAALAAHRTGTPKRNDGRVEALRVLRVARKSAVTERADVIRRMKSLVVTAPDELREQLRDLPVAELVRTCAAKRPDPKQAGSPAVAAAAAIALRSLARRHQRLAIEVSELDETIAPLVLAINPRLLELNGVGFDVAGQLLVTAGENPERVRSEAAFAMLCGAAPLPASSGKTNRHRLNRGGDRQANAALYRIVLVRLRWDERTRDYMAKRTKEGLSKKEITRCLKRYVAREVYAALNPTPQTTRHETRRQRPREACGSTESRTIRQVA